MAFAGRSDGALSPHSAVCANTPPGWFIPVFAGEFNGNHGTLAPHVIRDSTVQIKNARNIMSLENHKTGMPGTPFALRRSLVMGCAPGLSSDRISFQGAEREG
jgi:hypothetical protein